MNRRLFKAYIPIASCILLLFSCTCWAQSEEEMQFLRMFYKDKDLVVSSTRNEKLISQVAENITVITSDEIEAMNAHTVAEALNTVPGLFINSNQDFGTFSLINIQGSEDRHVLVLVDDVPWNFLSSGAAETSSIPIGIIDRIEIIKGPASSTWGSSLGGVINILTKQTGNTVKPTGSIRASYGKNNSQDYRAEISGKAGPAAGYYLYAGKQTSNGLISSRSFDGKDFLYKINMPVSQIGALGLEIGYTSTKTGFGDYQEGDLNYNSYQRNLYTTGSLNLSLTKDWALNLSLFNIGKKITLDYKTLGIFGDYGPHGTLIKKNIFKEDSTGIKGQAVWTKKAHTAVFGIEYDNGSLDQKNLTGPALQSMGYPAELVTTPDAGQWAVYVNDSMVIGRWSITPGVRYDYNSNSGSFVSPSLGTTYRLGNETILRGSVSRGFTSPPLSYVSGGAIFLSPNPSLEPEKIWSYQAGMESGIINFVWIKINLFRHDVKDIVKFVPYGAGPPDYNDIFINDGKSRRQGFEVETETMPFYNISLSAGFSRTDIDSPTERGASDIYSVDVRLKYDDNKSIYAEVSGRYRDSDIISDYPNSDYYDFIWDLNVKKKITTINKITPELFFAVHNILNGTQYFYVYNKNPERWLEGGIKLHFQ